MTDEQLEDVRMRIRALEVGVVFTLKKLFGADWEGVPHKNQFGIDFKRAVDDDRVGEAVFRAKLSNNTLTYIRR